jgi:4-hydroxyphenylpyruvate dioxygenase
MDPLSWGRDFRCMPGQGELPLVEYVGALKQRGYDGVLSLEIFNDRFRAGSTADVALDGMRSIEYLLEQVEGAPDARTVCKGVEFIEFCAKLAFAVPRPGATGMASKHVGSFSGQATTNFLKSPGSTTAAVTNPRLSIRNAMTKTMRA